MSSYTPNLLVVDDDPAMRRILTAWLEKAGYRVEQAHSGEEALATIEAECPDFLITDWEMPKLDGLDLCRKVRSLNLPHYIYILFLTVKSASDEMVAGLEAGADDFLTKPVHQSGLLARIRAGSRVLALQQRLSRMAKTDPLTGLLTQRTLFESLEREFERATRFHLPLSCVMMDIDFFKRINDIHGHPSGDACLKTVADLLADACRTSDSICRYGGEEFCAMLPETGEQGAARWAERVRQRLASLVIPIGGKEIRITASFGTAEKHDDTQTPEQLVDQADQALLCAKQSGRDRVVRFEALSNTNDLGPDHSPNHRDLFHGITARHVMTPAVACLRDDNTVGHAAEFFLRSRINSTPVVDDQGKLVGILSEKDLMAAMVSLDCWARPLSEVMKPNVICYEEDTPIHTVYEFLCRVSIRRVVIAKDGRPTGTISRGTLLRWFRNLVVSKGLLDYDEQPVEKSHQDPQSSQERLAETARELARQATDLEQRFHEDADDLVPYVVGGATQMQGLVTDLLAYSRYANETATGAAALQSILLGSSHAD